MSSTLILLNSDNTQASGPVLPSSPLPSLVILDSKFHIVPQRYVAVLDHTIAYRVGDYDNLLSCNNPVLRHVVYHVTDDAVPLFHRCPRRTAIQHCLWCTCSLFLDLLCVWSFRTWRNHLHLSNCCFCLGLVSSSLAVIHIQRFVMRLWHAVRGA